MAPADPDHLQAIKARLADVANIDQLSVAMVGGRMVFGINGRQIGFDPFSGDAEIETAIRLALSAPTAAPAAAPVQIETPMPAAAPAAPAPAKETTAVSVTGAAHVGTSLKDMLTQRKAKIAAAHDKLAANFDKLDTATDALDTLGDKVGSEADDLLAVVGQFTNDLG